MKTIKTETHLLLVDETAEIKEGNYSYIFNKLLIEEDYEESGKKSFLIKRSVKDKKTKLKFDVIIDVLNTLSEEQDLARQKLEDKEHNKKIFALIEEKKDEALKGKSLKDLEKMLR